MLIFALGAVRYWHNSRNGKQLDDTQLIWFALFAIVLDNIYLTLNAYMYFNSIGTLQDVSQSFGTQFQMFGIFDIALIWTFFYIAKKAFSQERNSVVQSAQSAQLPIQTKELIWRNPVGKSNDEKI